MDLPGCGTSGGDPKHLEPDAFKPEALAERLGVVMEQCLAERAARGLPPPQITLVGHSLGGTICLRLVSAPCLIAWGEWDETLPETMNHKIRDKVPGARLVEITGAGHSVISEKPLECGQIIRTCEAVVADERFPALAPVTSYGTTPFDGELTLAMDR